MLSHSGYVHTDRSKDVLAQKKKAQKMIRLKIAKNLAEARLNNDQENIKACEFLLGRLK